MRYITTINPTIEEWEHEDTKVTRDAVIAYSNLLLQNKLSPYDYEPVMGDDFIKNRITLVIEATPLP